MFYLGHVGRVITIGLTILLIVSVAVILITPDPTDDVDGLLHRHHSAQYTIVRLASGIWVRVRAECGWHSLPRPGLGHLNTLDTLALFCSFLC